MRSSCPLVNTTAEPRFLRAFVLGWLGVILILVNALLSALHVGTFGQMDDEGYSLIPIAGVVFVAWGLVSLIRSLLLYTSRESAKPNQPSPPGDGVDTHQT